MIRVLAIGLTITLAAAVLPQGTVEAAEEKKVKAQKSTKKAGGRINGQQLQYQLSESNKKKKGLKSP